MKKRVKKNLRYNKGIGVYMAVSWFRRLKWEVFFFLSLYNLMSANLTASTVKCSSFGKVVEDHSSWQNHWPGVEWNGLDGRLTGFLSDPNAPYNIQVSPEAAEAIAQEKYPIGFYNFQIRLLSTGERINFEGVERDRLQIDIEAEELVIRMFARKANTAKDTQNSPTLIRKIAPKPSQIPRSFEGPEDSSTVAIRALSKINDVSINDLEGGMRPNRLSDSGFLGVKESLLEVIASDNEWLVRNGFTRKDFETPLTQLVSLASAHGNGTFDWELNQVPLKIRVVQTVGSQESPFRDGTSSNIDLIITNQEKQKSIKVPGLAPDLIKFGFFQGVGSPYRTAPEDLVEVLEIKGSASETPEKEHVLSNQKQREKKYSLSPDGSISLNRTSQNKANQLPGWWFTGKIPTRQPIQRLNHIVFENWANAQPTELAPIVRFLRKNLYQVEQSEFEQALKDSFIKFLESRSNKKPLLFILPGSENGHTKSQVWVAGLLRKFFPEALKNAEYIVENDSLTGPRFEEAELKKISGGNYDVVMADDASYSGRQLYLTIDQVLTHVRRAGLPKVDQINLVFPYITNRAKARLGGGLTNTPLYSSHLMPTVEELIFSLPQTEKQAFENLGENLGKVLEREGVLTFFDHKLPDGISMPIAIWEGLVFEMKNGFIRRKTRTVPADQEGKTWEQPAQIPFLVRGNTPYRDEN